jgi:CheY-like chemotaxis protein
MRLRQSPLLHGLVVDDDPGMRSFATDVLCEAGFAVVSAADPEEALRIARLQTHAIDFLLTDYEMGAADGLALAAAMRGMFPSIRVIVMSGWNPDTVPYAGIADTFLRKPFSPAVLCQTLRGILDVGHTSNNPVPARYSARH